MATAATHISMSSKATDNNNNRSFVASYCKL